MGINLEWLRTNYLVVSSILIAASSGVSLLILSAYLAVFDWNLIWLLEYSDVAKIVLIGFTLVSSASVVVWVIWIGQDVHTWFVDKTPKHKVVKIGFALLLLGLLAMPATTIYEDYKSNSPLLAYHVLRFFCWIALAGFVLTAFANVDKWRAWRWPTIITDLTQLIFLLSLVGATFAYYVRDASGYTQEISTKDSKFANARVIMLLSHHIAFAVGKKVYIIPSSEIIRIESAASQP